MKPGGTNPKNKTKKKDSNHEIPSAAEPQPNETDDTRRRLMGWHLTPQSRSHVGVGAHFSNQQTSAAGSGGPQRNNDPARRHQEHQQLLRSAGVRPQLRVYVHPT